jgi:hypothetical protein
MTSLDQAAKSLPEGVRGAFFLDDEVFLQAQGDAELPV